MRERDIEKSLIKGVKRLGGVAFKWVSPGCRGVPDRIAFFPGGKIALVELKREDGSLSPSQKRAHAKLKSFGARVYTLYSFEDVLLFICDVRKSLGK